MDTKTKYLWTVICPKKNNARPQCVWSRWTLSHSSWYFKPTLDRTLVALQITEIEQNPLRQVLASTSGQKKSQSLSSKIFPKIGFKATIVYFKTWSFRVLRDKYKLSFVLSSWTCITSVKNLRVSRISFKQSSNYIIAKTSCWQWRIDFFVRKQPT